MKINVINSKEGEWYYIVSPDGYRDHLGQRMRHFRARPHKLENSALEGELEYAFYCEKAIDSGTGIWDEMPRPLILTCDTKTTLQFHPVRNQPVKDVATLPPGWHYA